MPEMNELLAQAAAAADALAGETARSRGTLADLQRGLATLTAAIDDGAREAEERFDEAGARLAAAEQELARDGATAVARVHTAAGSAQRVQAEAVALAARVRESFEGLRAEKERALDGLDTDADAARGGLVRYADALRTLEAEAAAHLERQRGQLAAVRLASLALREEAGARAEALLDGLRSVEDTARVELSGVAESYGSLGAALQTRGESLQQGAQALTESAAAELEQRIAHDAVDAARAAAEPFADALAAIERAAAGTRSVHGRGFEDVGRRLRDVTALLQEVKADLDALRRHLR